MPSWVLVGQWLGSAGASRGIPEFAGLEREHGGVVLDAAYGSQAMGWYKVVKTIRGRRYLDLQRSWREGKKVRTECRCLGREAADGGGALRVEREPETTTTCFYRGGEEGSIPRGLTARDVLDYEWQELGNERVATELGNTTEPLPAGLN